MLRFLAFTIIFFVLSWASDFASSVIMIIRLGSKSESNLAQDRLVQEPSLMHLYWWFMNELFYFILLAIILISFFAFRHLAKVHELKPLKWGLALLVAFVSLIFGGYRFIVGYFGNVNTIAAKFGLVWIVIFLTSFVAIVALGYKYVLFDSFSQSKKYESK